jgi:hypothetical protein
LHASLSCLLGERNSFGDFSPTCVWFKEFEYLLELRPLSEHLDKLALLCACTVGDQKEFLTNNRFSGFEQAKTALLEIDPDTNYSLVAAILHNKNMPSAIVSEQLNMLRKTPNGIEDLLCEIFYSSITPEVATMTRKLAKSGCDDIFRAAVEAEESDKSLFFRSKNILSIGFLPASLVRNIAMYLSVKEIIFFSQTYFLPSPIFSTVHF